MSGGILMRRGLQTGSRYILLLALMLAGCACAGKPAPKTDNRLRVLATTSIVADVVAQVGGGDIDLSVLMPIGTDPHEFTPRPQDAASLADADIVFTNGAGLEETLQPLLEGSGVMNRVVEVSQGIVLQALPGENKAGVDPHTWMDPNNVQVWVENIAGALSSQDAAHAANYRANADNYSTKLSSLDGWIRTEVEQVTAVKRILVVDHAVLGYFATRYGFTQPGSITGSFSSEAAPSAREFAALEDRIRSLDVRAVFISETVNQTLADQLAADTGIQTVWIYHASLTPVDGPAGSYLDFMRYNVSAIVDALK